LADKETHNRPPAAGEPDPYPYSYHIALDGNGINGLEGMAGVCVFKFNPADDSYAYKIQYFDGAAAGHAVAVNPSNTVGFLGNAGQHLLFYDARTLAELDRVSTLQFEPVETSLQGSTHLVWLSDEEFITAIGQHFYRCRLDHLGKPERMVRHDVKLPHAMKLSPSGRYLCYGSMDSPSLGAKGEARHVGIWDLKTNRTNILKLPATCWHVVPHRTEDLFYAVSFRVAPGDHRDYHEWAMAFLKEYAFEIDPVRGRVVRHWTAGRETPAHINSDLTMSTSELIFCNGGSGTIVFIDLDTLSRFRIIDERPDLSEVVQHAREMTTQVYDSFARANFFSNSKHFLGALRVSRFTLLDSVYGCQLSSDEKLLFTANRGLNHITVYDYPSNELRLRVRMPELQEYVPGLSEYSDPRLGFHHSVLCEKG
jgi:hypothetical protein